MEGYVKAMDIAMILHKTGKEDAFKLDTNLREKLNNALCVAEETKDELIAANQESGCK